MRLIGLYRQTKSDNHSDAFFPGIFPGLRQKDQYDILRNDTDARKPRRPVVPQFTIHQSADDSSRTTVNVRQITTIR